MNQPHHKSLHRYITAAALLTMAACSNTPKEPSLADQIRARGEMRLDVASGLDEGEAKIERAGKMARQATELERDAIKALKRADSYTEEAKKLRERSAKLQKEAEMLATEGTKQVNEAVATYKSITELPKVQTPDLEQPQKP